MILALVLAVAVIGGLIVFELIVARTHAHEVVPVFGWHSWQVNLAGGVLGALLGLLLVVLAHQASFGWACTVLLVGAVCGLALRVHHNREVRQVREDIKRRT